MALTSILMVSYHTGAVLRHGIALALAQEGLAELIMVNNGNPPEAEAYLRALERQQPAFRLITGQGNIGFAAGCNRAAEAATGEFLLLLNPDCLLPARVLPRLTEALEHTPQAMLAAPLLLNPDGSEQRGGRRALLTPDTALGEMMHAFRRGAPRLNLHHLPPPEHTVEVPAVSGACMAIRRRDYQALGGMDERYFLHVEDLDLCLRVYRGGGKILCVPEVKVVHWRSTSNTPSRFVERCKRDGFLRYFHAHYPQLPPWKKLALQGGIHARYAARCLMPHRLRSDRAARCGRQVLRFLEAAAAPAVTEKLGGMPILVTGATSQIGPFLLGRLVKARAEIHALTRETFHFNTLESVHWLNGDLASLASLPRCAAVIHCAPLWLLEAALPAFARAGVKRIIAFGSTSVFTKAHSSDAYERAVALRLSQAEARCKDRCSELGIDLTLLRPTLIYGLGTDRNVSRLAGSIRRGGWLLVYPPASGLRQPVHGDDLAAAALQALASDAARNKAYNLGGGETLSFMAMAQRIAQVLGKKLRVVKLPFLPWLLDGVGGILHNIGIHTSGLSGAMIRRMNENLNFPSVEAAADFAYAPRPFLRAGKHDLGMEDS
ncbi:MAG: glycosyltransferase [Alphaproteobacteria bacterium]|nr:glycosyltransferase [Alphaproteobacteria bacterium]